jgi:hypothetical protein
MQAVRCPKCRNRVALPATNCPHCGRDLSDAVENEKIEAKILQIRRAHENDWLRQPNVISVSTCMDVDGQYYIEVGVESLDEAVHIPEEIDSIPVRIELIGQIKPADLEQ